MNWVVNRLNKKKNELDENRYFNNYGEKIKRIKKGVIFVFIFASAIVASNATIEMQYHGAELALERAYRRYQDDLIDYETYNSIRDTLELDQLYFRRLFSVASGFAKVAINIGFLIVILGFLSITVDKSVTTKMRRISLILSTVLFLGVLYIIFTIILEEATPAEFFIVY